MRNQQSRALALSLLCGAMLGPAGALAAQPAESLAVALRNFGQQYGEPILFTEDLVQGLTTDSLQGELTAGADLNALLRPTGLIAERSSAGVWMIRRAPAAPVTSARATPGPIRVAQATPASPAESVAAEIAADEPLADVLVTASRVARDGFEAPTPTTVLGAEELQARAATNIADLINEIPSFRPSQTPAAGARGGANGSGGSFLDLRGLNGQGSTATSRTLVLVDGRRFVTSNGSGQVDINLIPTSLISRTEVVTGGASAAWGSDAVAGVVNLILKDRLQGFDGNVAYGAAEEGDYQELAASFAGGTSFASGRGHVIAGIEYVDNDGVRDAFETRDWGREAWGTVTLPANRAAGLPSRVLAADTRFSDRLAPGGVIVGGALDNITFLPGGQTSMFVPGSIVGGNQMVGGGSNDGIYFTAGSNLVSPIERYAVLARVNYSLTDTLDMLLEASHGQTDFTGYTASRRDDGSLVIRQDNAFLPQSIRQQMVARSLPTINVGRVAYDEGYGFYRNTTDQATQRFVVGLDGQLGAEWSWDVYYQWGENRYDQYNQATLNSNYAAAIDAVVAADGSIVCRPGPTNIDPGCVPFNIFGQSSPSQAAIDYVLEYWTNDLDTRQQVAAANLSGSPFSIWAGAVSMATGVEYRKEEAHSVVDQNSLLNRFDLGNPKPIDGSYSTKEIYVEAVAPLLSELPLAHSLELNGAVRYTDYSTSGGVTTWKAGLNYAPVADVRLRATKSRDIRAPNISELYSSAAFTRVNIANPFTGQGGVQVDQVTGGNPDLLPEEADTVTAGIVYQPSWLPRFRASADYFSIDIQDVISSFGAQLTIERCYAGVTALCNSIVFGPGQTITRVNVLQTNFNSLETNGVDVELAYEIPLGAPGRLGMRFFATWVGELTTTDPSGAIDRVRQTLPEWAANLSLAYTLDRLTTTAQLRYVGPTIADATLIGPDDPAYLPTLPNSISDNTRSEVYYVNLSAQYRVFDREGTRVEVFGVVNNLFDETPPPGGGANLTGASLFDLVGRAFRTGVRIHF